MIDIKLNPEAIICNVLVNSFGLNQYEKLMREHKFTNISGDKDFQRNFNAFFKVRRNTVWQNYYYAFFETNKIKKDLKFEDILYYMFEKTGYIEPSFSSKMLAIIKDDMPIWDQYVIKTLKLKVSGKTKKEKLTSTIENYYLMVEWYKVYKQTDEGKKCIEIFNDLILQYSYLSDIKKIDCFIWQNR